MVLKWLLLGAVSAGILLVSVCSDSPVSSGGGTRGGNPIVVGMIVRTDGTAAGDVRVSLIAAAYDPFSDEPVSPSSRDTTDTRGLFRITAPDSGLYTIEAVGLLSGERLARFSVVVFRDSVNVLPPDTLQVPGAITVTLPEADGGHLYIPGTTVGVVVPEGAATVELDSVPVGVLPALCYLRNDDRGTDTVRFDIVVETAMTTHIDNPQWCYSRTIILNTSASGADVHGMVVDFPVLIRLDAGNFDFAQARENGEDLLFTNAGNLVLPREIERWDADTNRAEIWVKVDTVRGDDADQSITMYWGNEAAVAESAGGTVFDTADGFEGVWHLGDAGDSVYDATVNGYHGGSPDISRPVEGEGVIGRCRIFDGIDDYLTMPGTADSRVNFPQDGKYTVCAWVNITAFTGMPQCIVSKGYKQYFLRGTYFPTESPLWEFAEFNETTNWQSSRSPATSGEWVFLTGVRQGKEQFLYCNGICVDSIKDVWPQDLSRDTTNDVAIGGFLKEVFVPDNDGYCFLKGAIDEVRIISATKDPDWIRLTYMNQKSDERFVELR